MALQLLQRLANLAPELKQASDDLEAYWAPEPPPPTVLAGKLAQSLADNAQRLPAEVLKEAFAICEQAIERGSIDESSAFATGFLEALQHADGLGGFDFRSVAHLLGPASVSHCRAMDRLHGVRTSGL